MFAGKARSTEWAGAYHRVEHLKGASLGYASALPANIRLGWKGLPGTNALAYYEKAYLTSVKSFITLAPENWQDAPSIPPSSGSRTYRRKLKNFFFLVPNDETE
jgi:hypothetical protein